MYGRNFQYNTKTINFLAKFQPIFEKWSEVWKCNKISANKDGEQLPSSIFSKVISKNMILLLFYQSKSCGFEKLLLVLILFRPAIFLFEYFFEWMIKINWFAKGRYFYFVKNNIFSFLKSLFLFFSWDWCPYI